MTTDSIWVPEACMLPTVEQPLRVAEFDELFATALRDVQRLEPTLLRLSFDPAAEGCARDLVAREALCCSFFVFTVAPTETEVVLDVKVPEAKTAVLDGIAVRAAAAREPA
ncbi:MAG: hypothetical protein ABI775_01775 [Pseudonocardiales bacterium]|nr:hypothetical protein [Actinomycetota bacterium]